MSGWLSRQPETDLGATGDTGFSTTVGKYRVVTSQDWNDAYVTEVRPIRGGESDYPLDEAKTTKLSKARENHRNMVIKWLRMSR